MIMHAYCGCGCVNRTPSSFPVFSFCSSPILIFSKSNQKCKSMHFRTVQSYIRTYPNYISSVDICSSPNKVYHYLLVVMKSSHMQWSALIERRNYKSKADKLLQLCYLGQEIKMMIIYLWLQSNLGVDQV